MNDSSASLPPNASGTRHKIRCSNARPAPGTSSPSECQLLNTSGVQGQGRGLNNEKSEMHSGFHSPQPFSVDQIMGSGDRMGVILAGDGTLVGDQS